MCSLSLLSDASGYKCTKVLKGLMKRECFIFSSCQVNIFLILRSTTKKKKREAGSRLDGAAAVHPPLGIHTQCMSTLMTRTPISAQGVKNLRRGKCGGSTG